MQNNDEVWKGILNKYPSFEGTISAFCKQQNIKKHQFYYYKKKFKEDNNSQIFHAITLNQERTNVTLTNYSVSKEIKIQLGKATISIPASETEALEVLIKGLSSIC